MCGIAGILDNNHNFQVEELESLVEQLKHRGPDDSGTFIENNFGFGMRRLSILDRELGRQPISNEDETKWVVFNGEIYNYVELKAELIEKGHKFKTNSDTETILHCYEEFGEDCPNRLQGMFAFAIWDSKEQKLFISRDRAGIKPFFYTWKNNRFVFSSELRGLVSSTPGKLSLEGLNHYFSFLYFPTIHTPFCDINKLMPGHNLILQNNSITIKKYYNPKLNTLKNESVTDKETIDEFLNLARSVIKKHLLSEVPLGAFLSGGVDSSLIVALMSEALEDPVNTFSIGYKHGGEYFDERVYAKQVAELYKTNHRELLISPDDVRRRLPEIIEKIGEPFGDASIIPNFLLSEYAKKYVTVALSGLGGDEVCGGYERHLGVLIAEKMPMAMAVLSNPIIRTVIKNLPDTKSGSQKIERLKRFSQYAELKDSSEIYFSFISKFNEDDKKLLFSKNTNKRLENNSSSNLFKTLWHNSSGKTTLSKILQTDIETYLTDDLLALSDRTSMANSLEMRVPFVDHTLLEFFQNLPDHIKIRGHQKKFLLKKAAERYLPKEIIYRKKTGFSIPIGVWFRKELKEYLHETIFSQSLIELDIFDHSYIEKLIDEHNNNIRNHDEKLFSILSFAIWLKTSSFKNK